MSELVKSKNTEVALSWDTPSNITLLRETYAKTITNDSDFNLFLNVARMSRLDPFQRQIYAIGRTNYHTKKVEMTIQTGIDGYRLIAARTGVHAGTDDAIFDSEDGPNPKWAMVTVRRILPSGHIAEFTAKARWSEYKQTKTGGELNNFWKTRPYGQLAKCAETLALRKAFPADMYGIYTEEEMGQADNDIKPQEKGKKTFDAKPEKVIEKSQKELEEEKTILIDTGYMIARNGLSGLEHWFTQKLNKEQRKLIGEIEAKAMKDLSKKINSEKNQTEINQSELDSFDSELEKIDVETGEVL